MACISVFCYSEIVKKGQSYFYENSRKKDRFIRSGILAVGAGGSTKLTAPGGVVKRLMAPKYPREYMDRIAHTCAEKDEIVRFYNSEPKGTN